MKQKQQQHHFLGGDGLVWVAGPLGPGGSIASACHSLPPIVPAAPGLAVLGPLSVSLSPLGASEVLEIGKSWKGSPSSPETRKVQWDGASEGRTGAGVHRNALCL